MAVREAMRSVGGMYSRLACFGLALVAVALVGCSEGPPTVGEARAFDSVCDKANDGHRVAVEGFLRLPDQITVVTNRSGGSATEILAVRLFQSGAFTGTPIGIDLDIGSEANQMDELPRPSYTDEDLKVHLTDGRTAGYGQRVRVSGTVYFPNDALKADDVDFDCGLNNPLVELTG